jgi:hypothetical protein
VLKKLEKINFYNNINETKAKSKFQKLKDNKVSLSEEERNYFKDNGGFWENGNCAIWKSVDKNGKITYVSHTHRAYATDSFKDGIIKKFNETIKETS